MNWIKFRQCIHHSYTYIFNTYASITFSNLFQNWNIDRLKKSIYHIKYSSELRTDIECSNRLKNWFMSSITMLLHVFMFDENVHSAWEQTFFDATLNGIGFSFFPLEIHTNFRLFSPKLFDCVGVSYHGTISIITQMNAKRPLHKNVCISFRTIRLFETFISFVMWFVWLLVSELNSNNNIQSELGTTKKQKSNQKKKKNKLNRNKSELESMFCALFARVCVCLCTRSRSYSFFFFSSFRRPNSFIYLLK